MDVKEFLSLASSASTIVVAAAAVLALRQLKLAREQIETTKELFKLQSRRASIEAAVVECKRFAETVIQDNVKIMQFCSDESITIFDDVKFSCDGESITVDPRGLNPEHIQKLKKISATINSFCNGIESHALYFLSGVADENLAYHTNARAYLELCETAYKIFALSGKDNEHIAPIQTLYVRWYKRLEAEQLEKEEMKIRTKLATYKNPTIRPIGT